MYSVYRGVIRQKGHGLGDVLKAAFRTVVPILKPVVSKGLHALKDAAVTHGKEFLHNVLVNQENLKDAFLKAGKNTLLQTRRDFLTPINTRYPSSDLSTTKSQQGSGKKRKNNQLHHIKRHQVTKKRKVLKRNSSRDLDIFDY